MARSLAGIRIAPFECQRLRNASLKNEEMNRLFFGVQIALNESKWSRQNIFALLLKTGVANIRNTKNLVFFSSKHNSC